jgi:hypothetical protein
MRVAQGRLDAGRHPENGLEFDGLGRRVGARIVHAASVGTSRPAAASPSAYKPTTLALLIVKFLPLIGPVFVVGEA